MLHSEEWFKASDLVNPVRQIFYQYRELPQPLLGTSGQLSEVHDTGRIYTNQYGYYDTTDDHDYSFDYDNQGRLEYSYLYIGGLSSTITAQRSYDLGDRLQGIQLSLYGIVDHENTFTYDAASRLTSITQSGPEATSKHVEFAYNRAGQFTGIDRYAAATPTNPLANTSFTYDATGRLGQLAHTQGSGSTLLAGYGYSYDDANRLTGIDFLPSAYNAEDVTYTYDDRGQIDTADYSGTGGIEEDYYFDANGNRVGSQVIAGASQSYAGTAGTNNRLTFDGTFSYAYDNNGNRIARFIDDSDGVLDSGDTAITEYEWDHRNRLTTVTERATFGGAATQTVEYDYDYLNQLVSRTVDADGNPGTTGDITQTKYVYDNGQVVLQFEKTGTGNLTASDRSNRYLWGPVVDQLLADEQIDWTNNEANGEVLWALTDHLGTVRDLLNSSGVVQNHKSYDAFGNVTAETNAAKDAVFGFTGKLFDDATGLQNNLNRWYDAGVGSWISEDPIGFAGGDANLGRYVGNSPTVFADPSGLYGPGIIGYPPGPPVGGNPWAPAVPGLPGPISGPGDISIGIGGSIGGYPALPWIGGGPLNLELGFTFFFNPFSWESDCSFGFQRGFGAGIGGSVDFNIYFSPDGRPSEVAHGPFGFYELDTPVGDFGYQYGTAPGYPYEMYSGGIGYGPELGISTGSGVNP